MDLGGLEGRLDGVPRRAGGYGGGNGTVRHPDRTAMVQDVCA